MKKKTVIGFLYAGERLGKEEKLFVELARKKGIKLVLFNVLDKIKEEEFAERLKPCSLVYNLSEKEAALEFVKTAEELGKKVVDSSKLFYYTEDKWLFYVKCKKHKIPTLETVLLSENLKKVKKELQDFGYWPVVLKRVNGCMGKYVDKAENPSEAVEVIKKFWKKGSEVIPVIAQEFVLSPSYRITVIDGKVVQTAIKKSRTWKATGVHGFKFDEVKVDKKLKAIVDKVVKVSGIKICGIDLLKRGDKWLVLEVNAEPGLDFFDDDERRMIGLVLNYLLKVAQRKR